MKLLEERVKNCYGIQKIIREKLADELIIYELQRHLEIKYQ